MENVINFDLLKEYDGTLKEVLKVWQKEKSYSVDDTIQYKGNYLKCTTAGTSGTTTLDFTDIDVGDTITDGTVVWEVIEPPSSGGGISIWQASTAYNVNDVVIDSNLIWQCAIAHTSTTTFDESKWICISGGEISNGLEIVTLWEGSHSFSDSTPIQLSEPIANFKYLRLFTEYRSLQKDEQGSGLVYVPYILASGSAVRISSMASNSAYSSVDVSMSDSTHIYLHDTNFTSSWPYSYVTRVEGIRKAKPIVSSGMKYVTLWEGSVGSIDGDVSDVNITLNDVYTKYRKIGISVNFGGSSVSQRYYEFNSSEITTNSNIMIPYGLGTSEYRVGGFKSVNQTTLTAGAYNHAVITKVIGISEGVQIPTGVQAARVTLWEGNYGSEGSSIELSDSITNYDQLIFTINGAVYSTEDNYVDNIINIDDNTYNKVSFRLFCGWQVEGASFNIKFTDATHFTIVHKNASSWATGSAITRVVGIKYIQPDSYSTEEKLIGTWIDGKPLYRKVFENPTNPLDTGLTSSNSTVVNHYGYVKDADTPTHYFRIPYADGGYSGGCYYDSSNGRITMNNTGGGGFIYVYVVVEYTKN